MTDASDEGLALVAYPPMPALSANDSLLRKDQKSARRLRLCETFVAGRVNNCLWLAPHSGRLPQQSVEVVIGEALLLLDELAGKPAQDLCRAEEQDSVAETSPDRAIRLVYPSVLQVGDRSQLNFLEVA